MANKQQPFDARLSVRPSVPHVPCYEGEMTLPSKPVFKDGVVVSSISKSPYTPPQKRYTVNQFNPTLLEANGMLSDASSVRMSSRNTIENLETLAETL